MSSSKQVSGSLSSRVMNMKFMKFSKNDSDTTDSLLNDRSISNNSSNDSNITINGNFRDNSEWSLDRQTTSSSSSTTNTTAAIPNKTKKTIIIKKRKRFLPNIVQDVGVTTLQREMNYHNNTKGNAPILGRLNFGIKREEQQKLYTKVSDGEEETVSKKRKQNNNDEEEEEEEDDDDDYELDTMFKESIKHKMSNKKSGKNNKTKKQKR
ncbi:Mpp6p NDAI_0K01600 [Naumovozyma dairenensis CBS 421]|uniref:Uncharacterized protein n=1 Tax=Naumovozyma dairenensis (strain ATCC 10597 / BCRC 20456 / CBS 421 / NBRC 0211 / NRRL Y-12639) TaxID=1071378 RepID=G0WHU0_NAUDC|nr:hypothetical protein NDAI_0K01600 [Naumovozyma dairenensis CBS 421]CCD27351.1 hypothetical protein NDAI_0K01600 [Naumovozyma dairenensis CBS 421]